MCSHTSLAARLLLCNVWLKSQRMSPTFSFPVLLNIIFSSQLIHCSCCRSWYTTLVPLLLLEGLTTGLLPVSAAGMHINTTTAAAAGMVLHLDQQAQKM